MFPFLIGTVRTKNRWKVTVDTSLFPFLIGTVRTKPPHFHCVMTFSFPFLIGTVRTSYLPAEHLTATVVSIPHRYGKNYPTHLTTTRIYHVSIPHRYGKNGEERKEEIINGIGFHSS